MPMNGEGFEMKEWDDSESCVVRNVEKKGRRKKRVKTNVLKFSE